MSGNDKKGVNIAPYTTGTAKNEFNIPMAEIRRGIQVYGESEQDDLLWFVGYIREQKHNSKPIAMQLLSSDWTTISRIYKGTYSAGISNFIDKIQAVRRAAVSATTEFIPTVVTKRIFDVMDIAKDYGKMVLISGGSGRSKTHSVKEWRMINSNGSSIYIDIPAVGGARAFFKEFGKKLGIKGYHGTQAILEKIEESVDRRTTLIFDEVVRLLPKNKNAVSPVLEFIRRLHDITGCGIVFVATHIFENEMKFGDHKAYMEQLLGRFEEVVEIPNTILKAEVKNICDAFNPDSDKELYRVALDTATQQGKIRVLFTLMRQAEAFAAGKKEQLNASHLKVAVGARNNRHVWPK